MTPISPDQPRIPAGRRPAWISRRRPQARLDPVAALGQRLVAGRSDGIRRRLGDPVGIVRRQLGRPHQLDQRLRDLAVMAVAGKIGCAGCPDFGYWEASMNDHVPAEQARAVPDWWDSDVFTELERLVLGYAEAMTATPPAVTDELVARLREHLSAAQLVELATMVAVQNLRSRINAALGPAAAQSRSRPEIQAAAR
jgi:alkylhydroperoxidase family enzyme